jgi:signal transduction histidine kinase
MKQPARSHTLDPLLQGRWLLLARVGWVVLTLLVLALNAISVPRAAALLQAVCQPGAVCISGLTPANLRQLQQLGLSPGFLAAYHIGHAVGTTLLYTALAALISWRRSADRMALFCAYMLELFGGATYTDLLNFGLRTGAPAWYWLVGGLELVAQVSVLTFFLLFPSGRFVPRWTRWGVLVFTLYWVWYLFLSTAYLGQLPAAGSLVFAALILSLAGVQVYRYQRVSTVRERQQTRWVVFGLALALGGFALFLISVTLLHLREPNSSVASRVLFQNTVGGGLLLFVPISIAIAILRSRLWEIDIIINRTLVYGLLTALVAGVYVLVVGVLGTLLHAFGNVLISLLATGLVAVLFQPLRARLQRMINRLMYGERDDPYAVLSRLGNRLKATLTPEAMLPTIVETVAQALKLPYAAITLKQGDAFFTTTSYGVAQDPLFTLPIVHQSEIVGQLQLASRGPSETFTPADRTLLEAIASHAGIAAHAVQLTTDLQRSREYLVTAREEERRRLRRDLHDGLGPTLASMTLKLDAARLLLTQNPVALDPLLVELKAQTQTTIADIRRLVYELRPPSLDELGLVSALREQAAHYSQFNGVPVSIEAPTCLPTLPAAVEVAIYRIVLEALTNVISNPFK